MKSNDKKVLFIAQTLALLTFVQAPISAITDAKAINSKSNSTHSHKEKKSLTKDKKLSAAQEEDAPITSGPGQDKLALAAQAYQDKPDDNTYNELWDCFIAFTQQATEKHKDPAHLFKSWKILSQAGLKVIEPFGANSTTHIYTFNHMPQNSYSFVPQTKCALLQWSDQVAVAPALTTSHKARQNKSHAKKAKTIAVIKTQSLSIPSYVDIKEATLLPHAIVVAKTAIAKTKGVKTKGAKIKTAKVCVAGRYLAISGIDAQSGHTWILGLKQSGSNWSNCSDIFQDVPPFLQSSIAKARFSGNNLVVSMAGPTGYELVMPFVEDHFAFSTREAQDSASAVAHQFLMALQYKRMDLARVWLADPKLASIPGYLGLYNRSADSPPLRLVGMPQPICGGSRFRLITSGKDDLIIDIAKVKTQLLIKALFIAPGSQQSSLISKTNQN